MAIDRTFPHTLRETPMKIALHSAAVAFVLILVGQPVSAEAPAPGPQGAPRPAAKPSPTPSPPIDPLVQPADSPTADHYNAAEQRRRDAINRQLGTIEDMRWYNGMPPTWAGQVPYRTVPSLEYLYATGWSGYWYQPTTRWYGGPDVFEPWPVVPGDIWGYRRPDYVRQPIGQQQIQTGPNRWESRPIFPEDLRREPAPAAPPAGEAPPPGPREF